MSNLQFEKQPMLFSMDEYNTRVKRAREEMEQQGIDLLILIKPANFTYLTGFFGTFYNYMCFLLPLEKDPVFINTVLEEVNIPAYTWVKNTAPYSHFAAPPKNDPVAHTAQVIKDLGLAQGKIGLELGVWWHTSVQIEQLKGLLPGANFVNATGLVDKIRVIKSAAEINYMKQAGKALSKSMYAGIDAVAEGKTEFDVAAAVWKVLLAEGSNHASGPVWVLSGPRSGLPHSDYSSRKFEKGDPVFIEFHGVIHRYCTPMMRMVAVGGFSKEYQDMFDVALEALNNGVNAVKPGVTSGEVDAIVRGTMAKGGQGDYFRHRTAYTVGLGYPPSYVDPPFIQQSDPTVLQPGMVFHMVPGLFRYGVGICISEPILVTETGCELLGDVERKLYVR